MLHHKKASFSNNSINSRAFLNVLLETLLETTGLQRQKLCLDHIHCLILKILAKTKLQPSELIMAFSFCC